MVFHRHAQHLADDAHRQRVGKVLDDVNLALGLRRIEELINDLLDPRPQAVHGLGSEGLVHKAAQPRVVGRVEEEERPRLAEEDVRLLRPLLLEEAFELVRVAEVAARARVAQDGDAVGVATQHNAAEGRWINRRLGAQPRVYGVGVDAKVRVEGIEQDRRGFLHGDTPSCKPAPLC